MPGRGELTDHAWAAIAPLLPPDGRRGGRWRDHRQVINAVLWRLRTGAPWRDLPERYGPWKKLLEHVVVTGDAVGHIEWEISIDSTSVRAHQHAAGARKKGAVHPRSKPWPSPVKPWDAPAGG